MITRVRSSMYTGTPKNDMLVNREDPDEMSKCFISSGSKQITKPKTI